MRRILKCLLAALWIAMALIVPAAQADDGTAWIEQPCPVGEGGIHKDHWETVQREDCTHGSIEIYSCIYCGKSHTYSYPAPGHQWDDGKVTKEPTCTEAGERTYTCTRLITNIWCGEKRKETIPALGHNPETIPGKKATCTENGLTDGSRCKRCGATLIAQETIPALGHAWDNGTVTKAPTTTAEGVRTFTCKHNSGHTKTESIPKLPPEAPPPAAHEHTWDNWKNDESVQASCIQYKIQYRTCKSCGKKEYQHAGYGDHDWGDWYVTKEPTAADPGTEERICKLDASHREEREIPATGEPGEPKAEGILIVTKLAGDTNQPLAGAHFRVDGPDVMDEWISTTEPHTVEGLVVNEIYTLFEVDAPEGYKTADSITFRIGETNPLSLTVVDEKAGIHPSVTAECTWADDEGKGKRYVGAKIYIDMKVTNTGDCDVYFTDDFPSGTVRMPHPVGDGFLPGYCRVSPGESFTISRTISTVTQAQADEGSFCRSFTFTGHYLDTDGNGKTVASNSAAVSLPLTYPDGEGLEEKKFQLTLAYLYDEPAKDVYAPEDIVEAFYRLTNTGNVPVKAVGHFTVDGVDDFEWTPQAFDPADPGESVIYSQLRYQIQNGIAPGTETEDLLGTVTLHFYFTCHDPDTGEERSRTQTVTRTYKVANPGFTPWPIPEESDLTAVMKVTYFTSIDPEGYQLGEQYGTDLIVTNTGKVTIPAGGIQIYNPFTGYKSTYPFDLEPGESFGDYPGSWHVAAIAGEDVERGYIYLPPAQITWTDPDSGNEKTTYSNDLMLKVTGRSGLRLEKKLKSVPGSLGYFREGDTLEWELSITNTTKDPIKNVEVIDGADTVGTYDEIGPGQQCGITVSTGQVTEYDVSVGEVKNCFTVIGEDLRGARHFWFSNFAAAPTNERSVPVPDPAAPKGDEDEPKPDPGDPMGPVYGLKVGARITKEEAGSPLNGRYYELGETVNFIITVKNTGEVPLENVTVFDSLHGLDFPGAPKLLFSIGTADSIAPGGEASFNYTHTVQQGEIDYGWVINSATATYQFDGGKPGTPQKSNDVKVKAGNRENNNGGGTHGGDTGHLTPILPTAPGGMPLSCELRLNSLSDSEANYTLHACADHAGAAMNAEAAGQAGDWAGAAQIWREEAEAMYGLFYEAADDEGKAALLQEHAVFFAYADAWQALAGDEAAAELLRMKTAKMCCVIHTLPDKLPDSIVGAAEIQSGKTYEATLREIGALNGSDSAVTETYAGAAARTMKDIRAMLAGAKSCNYGDVFERGRQNWQMTLDNAVNIAYKAADKDTRKLIIAWRTALDTLYEAEKTLLEMLYPGNDTTVWEELMNLYKDRVFDFAKFR